MSQELACVLRRHQVDPYLVGGLAARPEGGQGRQRGAYQRSIAAVRLVAPEVFVANRRSRLHTFCLTAHV
jgi:hypothetical protein